MKVSIYHYLKDGIKVFYLLSIFHIIISCKNIEPISSKESGIKKANLKESGSSHHKENQRTSLEEVVYQSVEEVYSITKVKGSKGAERVWGENEKKANQARELIKLARNYLKKGDYDLALFSLDNAYFKIKEILGYLALRKVSIREIEVGLSNEGKIGWRRAGVSIVNARKELKKYITKYYDL